MSHTYCIRYNNDPALSDIESITLSNSSHEGWQDRAGLYRRMRYTDGPDAGQEFVMPFHTTVHDSEPQRLDMDEFAEFLEKASENGDEELDAPLEDLHDLLATAQALSDEWGKSVDIFIY